MTLSLWTEVNSADRLRDCETDNTFYLAAHQFYGGPAYPWQYAYIPGRVKGGPGQPTEKENEDHKGQSKDLLQLN